MGTVRWTDDFFIRTCHVGDDLGDRTIRIIFEEHGVAAVNQMLLSLIRNDQVLSAQFPNLSPRAGEALGDFLGQSSTLPAWTDQQMIEAGEELYMEHGMMGFSILGCASLPEAYATAYASKVLGITQQLQAHIQRRIYETTQFVIDVMSTGGLKPDGRGIRSAQKVRLMHAAIRCLILSEPPAGAGGAPAANLGRAFENFSWPKEFGTPIHQVAMAMAILSFSYIVLRSLRKLGIDTPPEAETAYLHSWNVVGHIMGVHPDLLLDRPERIEQAVELYNLVWPRTTVESPEGKALEKALLAYLESFVPDILAPLRAVPRMLTCELIGDQMANVLDIQTDLVERVALAPLVRGLAGLNHLAGQSIATLPVARIAAEWLFRLIGQGLLDVQRGGDRTPFAIPTDLQNKWQFNQ